MGVDADMAIITTISLESNQKIEAILMCSHLDFSIRCAITYNATKGRR